MNIITAKTGLFFTNEKGETLAIITNDGKIVAKDYIVFTNPLFVFPPPTISEDELKKLLGT